MQLVYKAQEGQSLMDVSLNTYNSLERIVALAYDNGVSLDDDVKSAQEYVYESELVVVSPSEVSNATAAVVAENLAVYGINKQSLWDLATQTYGTIEQAVKLAKDADISLDEQNNVKNILFNYNTTLVADAFLYNFVNKLSAPMGTGIEEAAPIWVRITEDEVYRITEDSEYRFIEH